MSVHDTRARFRGFTDAGQFLDLASKAAESPRVPRWVWREYQAIFMGRMWLPRVKGGR